MRYVLDASVTACWHYHDECDPRASAAFDRLADGHAIVPIHWWFEVRNILLIGERRKRTSVEDTKRFIERLKGLPIELASLPSDADILALARQHRLTFYDACYLQLARTENVALATLDTELIDAARRENVELVT